MKSPRLYSKLGVVPSHLPRSWTSLPNYARGRLFSTFLFVLCIMRTRILNVPQAISWYTTTSPLSHRGHG